MFFFCNCSHWVMSSNSKNKFLKQSTEKCKQSNWCKEYAQRTVLRNNSFKFRTSNTTSNIQLLNFQFSYHPHLFLLLCKHLKKLLRVGSTLFAKSRKITKDVKSVEIAYPTLCKTPITWLYHYCHNNYYFRGFFPTLQN